MVIFKKRLKGIPRPGRKFSHITLKLYQNATPTGRGLDICTSLDSLAELTKHSEAVVFANMSATCITLSKAISKKDGERKFTRMALRCAWVTFELREFAAATTVRNACNLGAYFCVASADVRTSASRK